MRRVESSRVWIVSLQRQWGVRRSLRTIGRRSRRAKTANKCGKLRGCREGVGEKVRKTQFDSKAAPKSPCTTNGPEKKKKIKFYSRGLPSTPALTPSPPPTPPKHPNTHTLAHWVPFYYTNKLMYRICVWFFCCAFSNLKNKTKKNKEQTETKSKTTKPNITNSLYNRKCVWKEQITCARIDILTKWSAFPSMRKVTSHKNFFV